MNTHPARTSYHAPDSGPALLLPSAGPRLKTKGRLMNTDGNTAALDRYLAERESREECTQCGRPINGEPDIDGHYWTKHARYIDLCDNCGDDAESER